MGTGRGCDAGTAEASAVMGIVTISPPYSIVYIVNPDIDVDVPVYGGVLSDGDEFSIYVCTRSSQDGPTTFYIESGIPTFDIKYESFHKLKSSSGKFWIEMVDGVKVGDLIEVPGDRVVRICADDDFQPGQVSISTIR